MAALSRNFAEVGGGPPAPHEADRTLAVQMLSDRLEITIPCGASVCDLQAKLRHDLGKTGLVLHLDDGQQLANSMPLSAVPEGATVFCFVSPLATLEERLSELQSPGCKFQKYLRYLEGVPADDPRVKRTFWAFAVLARNAEEVEQPALPLDQVAGCTVVLLEAIWFWSERSWLPEEGAEGPLTLSPAEPMTEPLYELCERKTEDELQRMVAPYYSAEAHERILSWVLEDHEFCDDANAAQGLDEHGRRCSPRLRVALAELEGFLGRGIQYMLAGRFSNYRQEKAYRHLLKFLSCSPEVECWA